jgi:hypothetical protein
MRRRREDPGAAQLPASDGAAPGVVPTPVADESWTRRMAAGTRAFAEGLELPERTAQLGGYVRDHDSAARWTVISVGALVLLFWPDPTLSVLIWIVAFSALALGALEWLKDRAPEQAPASAVPQPRESPDLAVNGSTVVGSRGSTSGGAFPLPAGTSSAVPLEAGGEGAAAPAPRAPEPIVSPALTPATISTLNERMDLLVRLGAARDGGILSDEEFGREKSRLLGA